MIAERGEDVSDNTNPEKLSKKYSLAKMGDAEINKIVDELAEEFGITKPGAKPVMKSQHSDEERSIRKNKIIITVAVFVLDFVNVVFVLMNSTVNDTLYFHYVHNQSTGEPLGLILSIFLYILFWWLAGLILSGWVCVCTICLYYFLHRKDKRISERYYSPKYEEELYYGVELSFRVTYVVAFILILLHISNIVTVNMF